MGGVALSEPENSVVPTLQSGSPINRPLPLFEAPRFLPLPGQESRFKGAAPRQTGKGGWPAPVAPRSRTLEGRRRDTRKRARSQALARSKGISSLRVL